MSWKLVSNVKGKIIKGVEVYAMRSMLWVSSQIINDHPVTTERVLLLIKIVVVFICLPTRRRRWIYFRLPAPRGRS